MIRPTSPERAIQRRAEGRAALIVAFAMVAGAAAQETTRMSVGPAFDPPAAVGALAPNLTAGTDAVWMTWLEPRADGRHAVCAARWHGGAWGDAHTVTESADLFVNWADFSSVAIGADGWVIAGCPVNDPAIAARDDQVAVAWYTGAVPARVQVAFSSDGGATFDTPIIVDGEGPIGRVDVALVGDRAIVAWLGAAEGGSELRMSAVAADGEIGDPLIIANLSAARSAGFPSLVATEAGILVAWRETARRPRLRASLVPIERL